MGKCRPIGEKRERGKVGERDRQDPDAGGTLRARIACGGPSPMAEADSATPSVTPHSLPAPTAVLVAVDFEPPSRRALQTALSWYGGTADVTAIHVVDVGVAARVAAAGISTQAFATARMRERAEAQFDDLVRAMPGARFERMVVEGIPFVEVTKLAADLECDLIVVGARSAEAGLEHLLFGSTSEKVLRAARVPVLCVP
jgi:nucleotide-binding universal stress UspA family protein